MTSLWAAVIPVGCLCALSEREWARAVPACRRRHIHSRQHAIVKHRKQWSRGREITHFNISIYGASKLKWSQLCVCKQTPKKEICSVLERAMWSVSDARHVRCDTMGRAPTRNSEAFHVLLSLNKWRAWLREKHCLIRTLTYTKKKTLHFPTK